MRFERVSAYAFGPFRNETLELAPGMNVVYGPNEAGKSTWHAALYVGLCGMKRARGRPSRDDAEFAELHRPWGTDTRWDVGVIISLNDGRRVELRHDLAGGVDSSARDVDLAGRDYSNEVMYDGAPDGARWLGLNRRSFLMTACIRHADILGMLESPGELQDELQRAADTTDRDGTAAEALGRLRDFRAESVGSTRAPKKPLRITQDRVNDAQRRLEQAQAQHQEYLDRRMDVDQLNQRARLLERRLRVARAARAVAEASETVKRLERARELQSHFPGGAPRRPSQDENLVRRVASALAIWNQRPSVRLPEAETVEALEDRLSKINLHLAVDAELAARKAEKRLARAQELNARFPHGRPRRPSEEDQLVRLIASALTAWESRPSIHEPAGPALGELELDLARVEADLGERGESIVDRAREAGDGLFAKFLRAIRAFFGALLRRLGGQRPAPSMHPEKRRALDERRELIRQRIAARKDAERQREEGTRRVCEAADTVQKAAQAVGINATTTDAAAASLLEWQHVHTQRITEIDQQLNDWEELKQILGEGTLDELENNATAARDQAVSAASLTNAEALAAELGETDVAAPRETISGQRREVLIGRIAERRREEREYAEAVANVEAAEKEVAEAARLAGVEGQDPDEQVAALHVWQCDRHTELEEVDREIEAWEELQRMLGQYSLEELASEAERLRADADILSKDAGIVDIAKPVNPLTDAEFKRAESEASGARSEFENERVRLEESARQLVDVAEATEALAAAKIDFARVRSLDHTLELSIRFLEQAEERVHRTIAPVLAETVRHWLPEVSGGRYVDCRIAPEKLAVEVATANGRWQRAEVLSHGTAEQVYLLLRLALARHLTTQECPLILDDAVVASDSQRKHDLLETLLAVSQDTQVILFTHENDVCSWARDRLAGERHRFTGLDRVGTPTY